MKTNDDFLKDFPTAIEQSIASFKESIKSRQEGIEYRAMNYYNCVDDYSSGGICDKAAYEAISSYQGAIDALTRQAEHGKSFIEDFDCDVLCDLDGKVVSDRIVNCRFGSCWIIKDAEGRATFIGTARKQATYRKKGYKIMRHIYTVEYYFTTQHTFKGLITRGRVLAERFEDAPEKDLWVSDRLNRIAYFAINNQ